MRASKYVKCAAYPCDDVNHACFVVPDQQVTPAKIAMIMIAEAAPANPGDYYYAKGNPLFQQTTVQAFDDAGVHVASVKELLDYGVYLTTAVKCGKTSYGIKSRTIAECSLLLEQELALFPNWQVLMLMGDVAIKAVNCVARRAGEGRVIPAGSTYKIQGGKYFFQGRRIFPSYLQAGPAFFIEKSKRRAIAEDISAALSLLK